MKKYLAHFIIILSLLSISQTQNCDSGYMEINDFCFHEGDISVLQKMIDNSYASNIDLGCEDWDNYCGSPNPYMDSPDNWGWINYDGVGYPMPGNSNGFVEPLELGIQDWENGPILQTGSFLSRDGLIFFKRLALIF